MSIRIPTGDGVTPFFSIQVNLEDVTYTLQFRWNVRCKSWFMNIFDEQEITPILVGLRLVADWPLAKNNTGRQPPGLFFLSDTTGQGQDPAFEDLGARHQLLYFSSTELGL